MRIFHLYPAKHTYTNAINKKNKIEEKLTTGE